MAQALGYSRKFLEKFGDTVFKRLAENNKVFSHLYRIHSRDKTKTNLIPWLKQQLKSHKVKEIVKNRKWEVYSESGQHDYVMHQILKYVKSHITYKRDIAIHGQPEYWQTVDQTLQLKTGDCEDMSILILILGIISGVPPNRISLRWGKVVGGGHCYIVYRSEWDAVERILDACYWYTPLIIKFRSWFGAEKNYLTVWGNLRLENGEG